MGMFTEILEEIQHCLEEEFSWKKEKPKKPGIYIIVNREKGYRLINIVQYTPTQLIVRNTPTGWCNIETFPNDNLWYGPIPVLPDLPLKFD